MLLIPIMGMDNARPVRRFIGKEDHFTNLLFHDDYFYAVKRVSGTDAGRHGKYKNPCQLKYPDLVIRK